jgi:hypothetical protein
MRCGCGADHVSISVAFTRRWLRCIPEVCWRNADSRAVLHLYLHLVAILSMIPSPRQRNDSSCNGSWGKPRPCTCRRVFTEMHGPVETSYDVRFPWLAEDWLEAAKSQLLPWRHDECRGEVMVMLNAVSQANIVQHFDRLARYAPSA